MAYRNSLKVYYPLPINVKILLNFFIEIVVLH